MANIMTKKGVVIVQNWTTSSEAMDSSLCTQEMAKGIR